jgi:hypothetical protein
VLCNTGSVGFVISDGILFDLALIGFVIFIALFPLIPLPAGKEREDSMIY